MLERVCPFVKSDLSIGSIGEYVGLLERCGFYMVKSKGYREDRLLGSYLIQLFNEKSLVLQVQHI